MMRSLVARPRGEPGGQRQQLMAQPKPGESRKGEKGTQITSPYTRYHNKNTTNHSFKHGNRAGER